MSWSSPTARATSKASPTSPTDIWKPLIEVLGIKHYRLYALRHYRASALIADGANPKEVQAELGHEDIKLVFDVYGHLFSDDDAKQRRKDRAERLALQTQHAAWTWQKKVGNLRLIHA